MKKFSEIDWEQIVALDRFELREQNRSQRYSFALKRIAMVFFTSIDIGKLANTKYICIRSLVREDYKELFSQVVDTIQDEKFIIEDYVKQEKKVNWRVVCSFFFNLRVMQYIPIKSLSERLYIYIRILPHIDLLSRIKKVEFTHLLVFADMQPADNLLVQCFSEKTTITLQHGLYIDYHKSNTVNVINYKNQPSEYFLAWGENTQRLIKQYHPERKVHICGRPNQITAVTVEKNFHEKNYFSIIFDQNMFHHYNILLLDIARTVRQSLRIHINVKLHPWNNVKWYSIDKDKMFIDLPLNHSRFVIGHTSSMIYELMRAGVPSFKMKSDEHSIDTPNNLQFRNALELIQKVKMHEEKFDFKSQGAEYISYHGDESLNKYREFFMRLS